MHIKTVVFVDLHLMLPMLLFQLGVRQVLHREV